MDHYIPCLDQAAGAYQIYLHFHVRIGAGTVFLDRLSRFVTANQAVIDIFILLRFQLQARSDKIRGR